MIKENLEMCRICGGKCCKSMGCHFAPEDFRELTYEGLKKEMLKGYISIDWWEGDAQSKNNPKRNQTLFLRMRNKGARIVDASWGGECILLMATGCPLKFKDRPKGARFLEPTHTANSPCKINYSKQQCATDWIPYEPILKKLHQEFYK